MDGAEVTTITEVTMKEMIKHTMERVLTEVEAAGVEVAEAVVVVEEMLMNHETTSRSTKTKRKTLRNRHKVTQRTKQNPKRQL